ncbi:MAG: hypothetical protein LC768_10230 [Acidobacteria bacterium]|nr:hypothetical protein [Acidobacteriota bacterium]MCA1638693.1 hypothetical protein [Acidobacteriota bacterium]
MKTLKKSITALFLFVAVAMTVFVFNTQANAQYTRVRSNNNLSKAQVERILRRVEERTDRFVALFNDSLDNSRLNNSNRENNLNRRARDLESATDELRREFDRSDRWIENQDEVRRTLNIASDINVAMRNRRLGGATERTWNLLKTELNALARAFNLPAVGNSYTSSGNGGNFRNNLNKAQVDRLITNLETRVDRFVVQFDNSLDNSRLNNTNREANLNRRARDLEVATDELRREFNRRDRWIENKDEVRRCLNIASDFDVAMRNRRLGAATENNWRAVRSELNALAKVYGLPAIGGAYN